MHKKTVIYLVLTLLLTAYVAVAVPLSYAASEADPFSAIDIAVSDSAATRFVDAEYVNQRLGNLRGRSKDPRSTISTAQIDSILNSDVRIESASAVILNNGTLRVNVVPMVPVARVFDGARSYYINRAGKRLPATPGRYVDVPVINGHFTEASQLTRLLPMFQWLQRHPECDALVTGVSVTPRGDIYVIPAVTGHVVCIGDTSAIADKFNRLERFYREVLPVKGWLYYDTLSVKWRGRIVATRRNKSYVNPLAPVAIDPESDEVPDQGTVSLADGPPDLSTETY